MFAVGTGMTLGGLRAVTRRPVAVGAALAFQWLLLPLLVAAIDSVLQPPPLVTTALFLIAISPGGALSNAYTYLAGANTELSVAMTSLSTVLAVGSVPLLATWWLQNLETPVDGSLLAVQLLATVLVPVVAGMIIAARYPARITGAKRVLRMLVIGGIVLILIAVFAQNGAAVFANAIAVIAATLMFTFVAGGAAAVVGWLLGQEPRDRWALIFELATRNLAVASLVGASVGEPAVIAVAALFLLVQTPLMLGLARATRLSER